MRKIIELAILNAISYFILAVDIRSVSQANIPVAMIVNAFIAALSFSIVKRISNAKGWKEQAAYTVGGSLGVGIGIIFTKALLGK